MDTAPPPRRLIIAAGAAPFGLFLLIYLILPRHGFMIDDFAWVLQSRVRSVADLAAVFAHTNGFYRPLVSLTFTLDNWLFGNAPLGYGATNVALALGCAAAIAALGRALGLGRGAAVFFSGLWLLNFQGLRTAVLWMSGRSELVLVLCAVMSARAAVRGHRVSSVVWLGLALLAKEEAVLLPFILLGWIAMLRGDGRRTTVTPIAWIIGATGILSVYLLARHAAHAMTFATAPDYYRLTFAPHVVWRHIYIYADQVATFSTLVTVAAFALLGVPRPFVDRRTRLMAALGTLWLAGSYGVTIFVPSRSDLYACLPSVGVCLVAATLCERAWQSASPARRVRALVAVPLACLALAPIYHARTRSRSRVIGLASTTLPEIVRLVAPLPAGSRVVIYDDVRARATNAPNLEDAFGAMLDEAYELKTGRRLQFQIDVPSSPEAAPTDAAMRLQLLDGRISQLP